MQNRTFLCLTLLVLWTMTTIGCIGGGAEPTNVVSLTVNIEGNGSVNPASGTHEKERETTVTLSAEPDTDYEFSHWIGDVMDENHSQTQIFMNEDKIITAVFTKTAVDPDVLLVPAEYASIQAAVEAATDGALVLVSPGTYAEAVDFMGKAITISSTDPEDPDIVASTIIGGTGVTGPLVDFSNEEPPTAKLTGFTIKGAQGTPASRWQGAGIRIGVGAAPTIHRNSILDNDFYGILISQSHEPLITENNISGNKEAGLLIAHNSNGHVTNNVITDNVGTGIEIHSASPSIMNNTITGNTNSGIVVRDQSSDAVPGPHIEGNTIAENSRRFRGGGIYIYRMTAEIRGNTIHGNITGESGVQNPDSGGAGIAVYNGVAHIENNTITANVARGSFSGPGGGILFENASGTVSGNDIQENTAHTGGGIHLRQDTEVRVFSNTIQENHARLLGGGIYIANEQGAAILTEAGALWPSKDVPPGTPSSNSISNNTHDPPELIYDPSVAKDVRFEVED